MLFPQSVIEHIFDVITNNKNNDDNDNNIPILSLVP